MRELAPDHLLLEISVMLLSMAREERLQRPIHMHRG